MLKAKLNKETLKICHGVILFAIAKRDGELEILYTR